MAPLRMITVRSMSGSKPFLMHRPKQCADCLIVRTVHIMVYKSNEHIYTFFIFV